MHRPIAFQFHLSVEPDLEAGRPFSDQTRTVSSAGARGESCGEGIYSTLLPSYWFPQMAYEAVGEEPRHAYLVLVHEPGQGSVDAAHQDLSLPEDVVVLAKLMEIPDDDSPLDIGRLEWLADRWVASHPDAATYPWSSSAPVFR